ncbi:MAG: hypothetical protein ACOYXM_11350 [Actinomycetota bacterium]
MTTVRLVPPEPRHVVLADEADARMREAAREIEVLEARLSQIEAESRQIEPASPSEPGQADLPESAQLILRFVEDLVSTNRENMSDLLSDRYAWAAGRLRQAHAVAHELVNEALDEFATALHERGATRTNPLDTPPIAELISSIGRSSSAVLDAKDEPADAVASLDTAPHDETAVLDVVTVGAPEPAATNGLTWRDNDDHREGDSDPQDRAADPPVEMQPAATVDDMVSSAVQAVLHALTGSGDDGEHPIAAPASSSPASRSLGLLEAAVDDARRAIGDDAPAARAQPDLSPDPVADALIDEDLGDDDLGDEDLDEEGPDRDAETAPDDALATRFESFWSDEVAATDTSANPIVFGAVILPMLLVVVVIMLALVVIG